MELRDGTPDSVLNRLYASALALAGGRFAPWWLAAVAFAEASFLPIPPDALLVPMVVARPQRGWMFAVIATLGSVAGGALGYLIGYALFDVIAVPLLRAYHYEAGLVRFRDAYATYGVWVILLKGLTPIPYKLVTIASGAAKFDFGLFMVASLVTRGARFLLEAGLLKRFGPEASRIIERRLALVLGITVAAAMAGVAAVALL